MSYSKRQIVLSTTRQSEVIAAGTVAPGDLLERTTDGKVRRHSSVRGWHQSLFALEAFDGTPSKESTAGDTVRIFRAVPGDVVNASVNPGAAAIAQHAFLISDGAGGVMADDSMSAWDPMYAPSTAVGRALEPIDNSAGTARAKVAMEVI